jgi:hypothetical protein
VVLGRAGEHLIEHGPLAHPLPLGRGLELVLPQHGDRVNTLQPLGDRNADARTIRRVLLGQLSMVTLLRLPVPALTLGPLGEQG